GRAGQRIAERPQDIGHAVRIVDVHLAPVGADEHALALPVAADVRHLSPVLERPGSNIWEWSLYTRQVWSGRLRRRRREVLQAAGIGELHAARDFTEAVVGELLAIAQAVDIDRREEGDDRLGLTEADHLPEMGHEIEIAEPGEQGPPVAAKRNAVEAGVGD